MHPEGLHQPNHCAAVHLNLLLAPGPRQAVCRVSDLYCGDHLLEQFDDALTCCQSAVVGEGVQRIPSLFFRDHYATGGQTAKPIMEWPTLENGHVRDDGDDERESCVC